MSDFEFVALNQALRLDELPALGSDNLRGLRVIAERISGRTQRTITASRSPIEVPAALSELERERHRQYAEKILSRELVILGAMAKNSGRNDKAFCLVCRLDRWVHAGILSADRVIADVLEECHINELVSEDGASAVLATIASALRKSANDVLPDLGARRD